MIGSSVFERAKIVQPSSKPRRFQTEHELEIHFRLSIFLPASYEDDTVFFPLESRPEVQPASYVPAVYQAFCFSLAPDVKRAAFCGRRIHLSCQTQLKMGQFLKQSMLANFLASLFVSHPPLREKLT